MIINNNNKDCQILKKQFIVLSRFLDLVYTNGALE